MRRAPHQQRGNILFLILLAVILFAALSYAVTSSMRGGGKNTSAETAEAGMAAVTQWLTTLNNAVLRMHMSGMAYESMSFRYDSLRYGGTAISNYLNNTNCTSDSCRVFEVDGGGVAPQEFTKYATDDPTGAVIGSSLMPGYFSIRMAQWPGAGTDSNDVVLTLWYMNPDICTKLNAAYGITTPPTTTGSTVSVNDPADWDNSAITFTTNADQLYGKHMFGTVTQGTGAGQFCNMWSLIIAR